MLKSVEVIFFFKRPKSEDVYRSDLVPSQDHKSVAGI